MKAKRGILYVLILLLVGSLGVGGYYFNNRVASSGSTLDNVVSYVEDKNFTKALDELSKLNGSDQESNRTIYEKRIDILKKENALNDIQKSEESKRIIKNHLEKYPIKEDEDLRLQLMLVEELEKLDQKKSDDFKLAQKINKAIEANTNKKYEESEKILDKLKVNKKNNQSRLIDELKNANKEKESISSSIDGASFDLEEALNKEIDGIGIETQLVSDLSDNKNRGLTDVRISLLIKNNTKAVIELSPSKFTVNKKDLTKNQNVEEIKILPGAAHLLKDIIKDAQPEQLSGELEYGKQNIGKLLDAERGYFENERWVQL